MHDWEARAKVLEAENDELRARIAELEEALGLAAQPTPMFGLTSQEAVMFGVLLKTANPRKATFMTAIYSDEADDPPDEKIIDVMICKMRKKLEPFGIKIDTSSGEGFSMAEESKARRGSEWPRDPRQERPSFEIGRN
jgi:two-component system cell cycle response regulator CtrA